jgi:hypothetical protein
VSRGKWWRKGRRGEVQLETTRRRRASSSTVQLRLGFPIMSVLQAKASIYTLRFISKPSFGTRDEVLELSLPA